MRIIETPRYDPQLVQPMRDELTRLGFAELRNPEEVDAALRDRVETTLVVVNSICGCAAGRARPALALALRDGKRPVRLTTVFAGQDTAATEQARTYFAGYPPSSPSMGLLRDGKLVWMLERRQIEGRMPDAIAADIAAAFEQYC